MEIAHTVRDFHKKTQLSSELFGIYSYHFSHVLILSCWLNEWVLLESMHVLMCMKHDKSDGINSECFKEKGWKDRIQICVLRAAIELELLTLCILIFNI